MRTSPFRLVVLAWLLLLARPAAAQMATQLAAQLQQDVTNTQLINNLHGLSAAVLFPDQSVWAGTSGIATTSDSLLPTTLLGVGSITKTFTASIVLRLVERGQVQLDDSIAHYVPLVSQYPNIDPGVTVRQLLSHTSGVYNYTNNQQFLNAVTTVPPTHVFSTANVLSWIGPMRFPRGTRWEYSNSGYTLLGLLIEQVTGKTLSRAYRDELLDPQNLTSTWRGYSDTIPANLLVSHGWVQGAVGGPFVINVTNISRNALFSSCFGDGELLSTPTDLVRWAKALYGGTSVLDSASLAMMTTVNPLSTAAGAAYGLGAMRTVRSRRVMWGHNGSIPGYMATFGYVSSCGVAVAVMVNESNPMTEAAVNRLFAIVNRNVCGVAALADEVELPQPRLYPNPAQGSVSLTYNCPPGTQRAQLEVRDALGRTVRTLPLAVGANLAALDLGGLPAGLYSCRVRADERPGPAAQLVVQP